jgi:hypothetical protein
MAMEVDISMQETGSCFDPPRADDVLSESSRRRNRCWLSKCGNRSRDYCHKRRPPKNGHLQHKSDVDMRVRHECEEQANEQ